MGCWLQGRLGEEKINRKYRCFSQKCGGQRKGGPCGTQRVWREDTVLQDSVSERNHEGDTIICRGQAEGSPKRDVAVLGRRRQNTETVQRVWQTRGAPGSCTPRSPAWGSFSSRATLIPKVQF